MLLFDVRLSGRGLELMGTYGPAISGVGLATRGLVWPCADIWNIDNDGVTETTWTACDTPANVEDCVD